MGAAVVPGGEASPVLEPAEHAFDAARLRPPFIRGCTGFDLFEAQRIIAADRNARVVYMNRAAEQLLDKAIVSGWKRIDLFLPIAQRARHE